MWRSVENDDDETEHWRSEISVVDVIRLIDWNDWTHVERIDVWQNLNGRGQWGDWQFFIASFDSFLFLSLALSFLETQFYTPIDRLTIFSSRLTISSYSSNDEQRWQRDCLGNLSDQVVHHYDKDFDDDRDGDDDGRFAVDIVFSSVFLFWNERIVFGARSFRCGSLRLDSFRIVFSLSLFLSFQLERSLRWGWMTVDLARRERTIDPNGLQKKRTRRRRRREDWESTRLQV